MSPSSIQAFALSRAFRNSAQAGETRHPGGSAGAMLLFVDVSYHAAGTHLPCPVLHFEQERLAQRDCLDIIRKRFSRFVVPSGSCFGTPLTGHLSSDPRGPHVLHALSRGIQRCINYAGGCPSNLTPHRSVLVKFLPGDDPTAFRIGASDDALGARHHPSPPPCTDWHMVSCIRLRLLGVERAADHRHINIIWHPQAAYSFWRSMPSRNHPSQSPDLPHSPL